MELKSFVIELTGDGSPTLRLKKFNELHPEKQPESMHHSGGAASETLYIYTGPFKKSLAVKKDLSIGVVGLGLGYIELSFISELTDVNVFKITSFEKEQELVENLEAWMCGASNETYDLICDKLKVEKKKIFNQKLNWCRLRDLNPGSEVLDPFHFVAYDAFSQFTDGPLWSDEFLDFFLTNLCAKDCVFTTYACTGNLKRALQRNGFLFIKRIGFNGKRDATLALRGEFIPHQHLFQNV